MKWRPPELRRALTRPGSAPRGLLIHGEDAAQVAMLRDEAAAALGGPGAEADMRVARLAAQEARSNPEAIRNALMQKAFFPGPQVVLVSDVTDGMADMLAEAARGVEGEAAFLIATAGILPARSALRKRFEADSALVAVACYTEAVGSGEIVESLRNLGVVAVEPAAAEMLARLSGGLDRLGLQQLLVKLAIYRGAATGPLAAEDVAACAPPAEGADLDDVCIAILARDPDAVMATLTRLLAAGTGEVGIAIALGRVFVQLLEARLAMDGGRMAADAALGRLQPPMRLPVRKAAAVHLAGWSRGEIERALAAVHALDAGLRSEARLPAAALTERTLLRLALGNRA